MGKYHYNNYWGTWSRVLGINGHGTVEINLTPIRGGLDDDWQTDVAPGMIRVHGTRPDVKDRFLDTLPVEVRKNMEKNIGFQTTEWLLNHDFFSNIDFEKYYQNNNGGCAYDRCKKDDIASEFTKLVISSNKLVLKYKRLLEEASVMTSKYSEIIARARLIGNDDERQRAIYHRDKWYARAAVYQEIINDLDNLLT